MYIRRIWCVNSPKYTFFVFPYVVLHSSNYETEGQYILYGICFGIIVGACLGVIIYRKQQRMIDDLRSDIE